MNHTQQNHQDPPNMSLKKRLDWITTAVPFAIIFFLCLGFLFLHVWDPSF